MASKSRLKKLAAAKRVKEHELAKVKKENDRELKRHGMHPEQLAARKLSRENDYRYQRKKSRCIEPVIRSGIFRRETPDYPSVTKVGGQYVAEKRERDTYTGDKLLGITVIHKSNLVPIFSQEHAKDVSSMRR